MISDLCRQWRDRQSLTKAYVAAAERIEATLPPAALAVGSAVLPSLHTFSAFERQLVAVALRHLASGAVDEAAALAKARRLSFWSRERPEIQLRWAVVETAAEQIAGLRDVDQTLKTRAWALDELIDAYTRHAAPWMRIDRLERELETRFARCSAADGLDDSPLLDAVALCRTRYVETLDRLARAFSTALSAAGFRVTNAIPHSRTPDIGPEFDRISRKMLDKSA